MRQEDEQAVLIKKYFGLVGRDVCLCPGFMCDNGQNIHVEIREHLGIGKPITIGNDVYRIFRNSR